MANKHLIYWDSCIFLAWIKNEQDKGPEVLSGIEELVNHIQKNQIILITSVLTTAEILESTLDDKQAAVFDEVLKRRNVQVVDTTGPIWNLTHDIRNHYKQIKDGLHTLSTPDAVHLATAINEGVDVFYTTDEYDDPKKKKRALIPLNGNVAGYNLRIKKPLTKQLGLHFEVPDDEDKSVEANYPEEE